MFAKIPALALAACLALYASTAPAEEAAARPPLAKPGDTYVSLKVEGCANKCPSFEIYVFDNGWMAFRSNNKYTTAKGTMHKSGMPDVYNQISKYLQESGAFNAKADCAEKNADTSIAIAQAVNKDGQAQNASWSSSCSDQRAKGRAVVKVFVNQTGMWRMIRADTRWWEKYWEDPEMTGRKDVAQ